MKRSSLCCSRSARTSASASQSDDAEQRARLGGEPAFILPVAGRVKSASMKVALPSMLPPIMTFSSTDASPITPRGQKVAGNALRRPQHGKARRQRPSPRVIAPALAA